MPCRERHQVSGHSSGPASAGSNSTLGLTNVSTAAGATTVKNKINAVAKPGGNAGGTNWDRGLYQVAQSSDQFDVVMVITDGNPTFYSSAEGPGNRTRFREVENGIFSANAIKAKGTRVVAVGVGDGVDSAASGLNLRSISGPAKGSDYYQSSSYAEAGQALRTLALGNCQGSVSVVKQVIPEGGSVSQAQPAGGWTFTGTSGSSGVSVDGAAAKQTAADTGAVNFPLTFTGGTTSGSVSFSETQQTGYTLTQQGGKNAKCMRVDTGASVPTDNSGDLGFSVDASSTYPISCTVYNQAPSTQATVSVTKKWVVNGTKYNNGDQPQDLSAVPTLAGATKSFGTTYPGYTKGDSLAINEKLTNGLTLCTVDSQKLTDANGTTVSRDLPYTATLAGGDNHYTLTNTLTCKTTLTLTKKVEGGSAQPSAWTLDAAAPSGALAGPHGVTGSNAATDINVTPGATYPLAESSGPLEYKQKVVANADLIAGSTGSWYCDQLDASGKVIAASYDGLNGGVTVPFGSRVTCEAVNQTSSLTLVKKVNNDNGGTASADQFTLKATPSGDVPSGLDPQTVTGSTSGKTISVRPGTTYNLSETQLDGYTQDSLKCSIDGDDPVAVDHVKLDAGQDASCVFVNVDKPGSVTWSKDDGHSHLLAGSEWTLTGPGSASRVITDCTSAPCADGGDQDSDKGEFKLTGLKWGDYTLKETKAPAGYVLDSSPHTFTVNATHLTIALNNFKNDQASSPSLPLTGGTGTDIFLISGGVLLVGGAAGATIYGIRRRHRVHG
jgi:LPXTG-motif cell wall-anchored protein